MAHSTTNAVDLSDANLSGARLAGSARTLIGAGIVLLAAGAWLGWRANDPTFFAKSYLLAFLFALAICLGALFFVTVQHLTRAGWSVAVRRPAEAIAQNLRWIWILFLPIVWLAWTHRLDVLYPWANLDHVRSVAPAEAELLEKKAVFFELPFFFGRAIAYFVVWGVLSGIFWRASVRQDTEGGTRLSSFCRRISGPGMILFGVTSTLAAVDWGMSLSPAWFSTMFGVYFFAACATCGISVITLSCLALQRAGLLRGVITTEHYHDLGKLLFAFGIVFWAYIAFSQYMLIWYGNIPEETVWYMPRQVGGWLWLSWALLFGHFVIPFLFLISRWTKRIRGSLAFGCAWMLFFGFVDLFYLIMPTVPHDAGEYRSWSEFADHYAGESTRFADPLVWTLALGMLCLVVGMSRRAISGTSVLPKGDPSLGESLAFQNM